MFTTLLHSHCNIPIYIQDSNLRNEFCQENRKFCFIYVIFMVTFLCKIHRMYYEKIIIMEGVAMKEIAAVIYAGNCCSGPSISIPVMPDDPQLGHTYTPYQVYRGILPAMEGLKKGTVFKELYQPYDEKKEERLWTNINKQPTLPEVNKQLPTKQTEKTEPLINDKYIRGTVYSDNQ